MSVIKKNLLRDFSKKVTIKTVFNDIARVYKIRNIVDDDDLALNEISYILLGDYERKIVNYKSYIDYNMDLRMLIELRKNAALPLDKELHDFYPKHDSCKTPQDVINLRIDLIKKINSDYIDAYWQYYYIILFCYGKKAFDFPCDMESFCADATRFHNTNCYDYKRDFMLAHLDGYPGEIRWAKD